MVLNRQFSMRVEKMFFVGVMWCTLVATVHAEVREWKDRTLRHTLDAELISKSETKVLLQGTDGKTYEIGIDQLSLRDRSFLEVRGSSAPFKRSDESPFKETKARATGGMGRSIPVAPAPDKETKGGNTDSSVPRTESSEHPAPNWSKAELIKVEGLPAGWNYRPAKADIPQYQAKNISLPKAEQKEEVVLRGIASNAFAKRVAIVVGTSDSTRRLFLGDLETGLLVATQVYQQPVRLLSVHSDGQHVLLRGDKYDNPAWLRIDRLQGNGLVPQCEFEPYADEPIDKDGDARYVKWAEFVGDDQLLTCSAQGRVILWNLPDVQPVCHFRIDRNLNRFSHFAVAISPDRKVAAVADAKNLYLFDTATRSLPAIIPVPEGLQPNDLAFSPSGERIAAGGTFRVVAWDAQNGDVTSDFRTFGVAGMGLLFTDENFLLIGSSFLIDLENQVKLWKYTGNSHSAAVGTTTLLADFSSDYRGAIMAGHLPHPEALKTLEDVKARGDLFMMKPGDTVSLDVSEIPAEHQEEIRTGLTAKLEKNGIKVGQGTSATMKASIQGKPQIVTYSGFGTGISNMETTVLHSKIEITAEGKIGWSQQVSNVPTAFLPARKDQKPRDVVLERLAKPNLLFFETVRVPQIVQKPSDDGNFAPLGRTTISAKGLNPDAKTTGGRDRKR